MLVQRTLKGSSFLRELRSVMAEAAGGKLAVVHETTGRRAAG